MKILANDGISKAGIDVLSNAGYTVITDKIEQGDLINYINSENIEVLLVRSATTVRQDMIDACPGLKLIGRGGVGSGTLLPAHIYRRTALCGCGDPVAGAWLSGAHVFQGEPAGLPAAHFQQFEIRRIAPYPPGGCGVYQRRQVIG